MITPQPVSKGTKVRRVAKFLGRRMEYTPEVTEYVPGELLVMRTDSPFDMTISYSFEDSDSATLVKLRVQGEGTGLYKVAGPLLGQMVKRNITKDLQALKRILEA